MLFGFDAILVGIDAIPIETNAMLIRSSAMSIGAQAVRDGGSVRLEVVNRAENRLSRGLARILGVNLVFGTHRSREGRVSRLLSGFYLGGDAALNVILLPSKFT